MINGLLTMVGSIKQYMYSTYTALYVLYMPKDASGKFICAAFRLNHELKLKRGRKEETCFSQNFTDQYIL